MKRKIDFGRPIDKVPIACTIVANAQVKRSIDKLIAARKLSEIFRHF
ncbi:hypothetical protein ACE1B6_07765 [Aerosakkonemataceae cyanobacterium BLCC-F154]|uniref:Ribosomal protein S7 n=1 Tax=Floridaenema fluviatile BLCC-F154 TaxID=3153640 RepID=A0ABV4Y9G8_9CYAN